MAETSKVTTLAHLKDLADRNIQHTDNLVAELAEAVADVVEEVNQIKADKASAAAFTIETTNWSASGYADYPYAWTYTISDLTTYDSVTITVTPESIDTAMECGLCPTCKSDEATLTIYAAAVPSASISAEYYVVKGTVSE